MQDKLHYDGVYEATKKDGSLYYRASLTYKSKHISLGSYSTPTDAHNAYMEGLQLLNDPSLSLIDFREDCLLMFEKWVILLNFRNNGIYFGTPIYVGQKMFYYYLSPTHVLKFDLDDLFYFASHKIMCRGNHYFVADYGMQVNIASRFGIKNYAVPGRDFRFLNQDPTDFRRENLEILNTYHGVTLEQKKGRYIYTVRIHLKGNYLVGRYEQEWHAAIAYNKAIDILKRKGVTKSFTPNYIEGISPREYAEIYTQVKISSKLTEYIPEVIN
ncbi:MAG: hypothetical protein IJ335_03155 [Lachnospiraceae bacterium]|nr:hypothetical protein [Lachnospiraceae bacterium]